ncbi:predicted protein [Uncinocarpus reesii 1704]|uniref:ABM domain-containing protein n=1 Tax=Uncinocarpus reesii (strain UAMH 1704) TaxID=336963 RepID=C4JPP3_UNCRE|nr:uncharacterized protein UREG_03215 [Uncinocarpus reesii 1704]EEP78369.1 predicted protein [Uncinocarpus reesii 1704]
MTLMAALRCLTSDQNVLDVAWGRVEEKRSHVYVVANWKTKESAEMFLTSERKRDYHAMLSSASDNAQNPITYIVNFKPGFWIPNLLNRRTEVAKVFFQAPMSVELQREISAFLGKAGEHSSGSSKTIKAPVDCLVSQGWVDGLTEQNGKTLKGSLWLHGWRNSERERVWKTEYRPGVDPADQSKFLKVDEYWKVMLEHFGAVRWEEGHCNFIRIPDAAFQQPEN